MSFPAPTCRPLGTLSVPAWASLGALVAAAVALSIHLWPEWLSDDNLSHGPLVPVLSVILLFESRRSPRPRFLRGAPVLLALGSLLTASALGTLLIATVYAAAVGWSHALVNFLLAASLVQAGAVAWLGLADRRDQIMPFDWAAGVAVALWLFAAPTPPGTYARVALALQGLVTHGVVGCLHALGIAAFRNGNSIDLARTSVGVSEACSGVRSLVSCTVAGLFLSAVLVRRPAYRWTVIIAAPLIGLAMNLLRSLLLTLLANGGVNIAGRWHDLTGSAIIAVTTALVAVLSYGLGRRESDPPGTPLPARAAGRSPLPLLLGAGLVVAAAGAVGLALRTHPDARPSGPAPDLSALFPAAPAGWTAQAPADLESFSAVLQTHALAGRTYLAGPDLQGAHVTLYVAYWRPGQAPVSLVDAHTPDACWPGTGWVAQPVPEPRIALEVAGRPLAPAEWRRFMHGPNQTQVWYWHLYGGRPLAIVDPYSVTRLLRITLHYGFGQPQDQLFVRVSSDRPWAEIASLPMVQQFFSRLQPLGL